MKNRLKEVRNEYSNMTQADMAQLLNINTRQYQRYEAGETDIPVSKLITMATIFECNLDFLVYRTDDPKALPYSQYWLSKSE
ncbi:helix-turn-helix transcriptional regulator [Enterococcus rotai]|uniref:helix-turn-helix transcriptional regulator n=1 Tax=Enterococcus rotai TaxID=118060 RepID=UPI0032B3F200